MAKCQSRRRILTEGAELLHLPLISHTPDSSTETHCIPVPEIVIKVQDLGVFIKNYNVRLLASKFLKTFFFSRLQRFSRFPSTETHVSIGLKGGESRAGGGGSSEKEGSVKSKTEGGDRHTERKDQQTQTNPLPVRALVPSSSRADAHLQARISASTPLK